MSEYGVEYFRKDKEMEEEYIEIGKIDTTLFKDIYNTKTDRLIITKERIEHINKKHNNKS